MLKCNFCNVKFKYNTSLKVHMNKYHKEDVKCDFCDLNFETQQAKMGHIETDHQIKEILICNFCKKNFSRRFNLKRHISTVHDYHCGICDRKFTEQRLWRNHISIYKDPSKMRFDCCKCNAKFSTLPNLALHCLSVHEIKIKVRL